MTRLLLPLALAGLLGACATAQPPLAYQPPTSGPIASLRYRLADPVAFGYVTVVENCTERKRAGVLRSAGRMLESDRLDPALAEMRIDIAAGVPHAASIFLDRAGNGNVTCPTALSFRPVGGAHYEAEIRFNQQRRQCSVDLYRVLPGGQRVAQEGMPSPSCI